MPAINEAPPCPICKRPMEPFEGAWKCAHGTQFNDLFRPDKRPGRWRVARGLLWSLVGTRIRNHRAERAARERRKQGSGMSERHELDAFGSVRNASRGTSSSR